MRPKPRDGDFTYRIRLSDGSTPRESDSSLACARSISTAYEYYLVLSYGILHSLERHTLWYVPISPVRADKPRFVNIRATVSFAPSIVSTKTSAEPSR